MIPAPHEFDFPQMPFVFVRHGETQANRDGIIAGSQDVPLNEFGRAQAMALAPVLSGVAWRAVHASPQGRARETARLAVPGYDAIIHDGLRERHWGDLEGRPVSELTPRFATPPGGEAFGDMCQRVADALRNALLGGGNSPTASDKDPDKGQSTAQSASQGPAWAGTMAGDGQAGDQPHTEFAPAGFGATALRMAGMAPPAVIVAHSGVGRCILHMTGFAADGPRIANATPILFCPRPGGGWSKTGLDRAMITQIWPV